MKFTGTLSLINLDLEAYKRQLEDELMDKLSFAVVEWLQATAENIPQWSGASAATFLHLAREFGYSLSINPVVSSRIPLGLRESEGTFSADRDRGRYSFHYSTTLRHLVFNEYENANNGGDPAVFFRLLNPGPYDFQTKGQAAFQRVASRVTLPRPVFKTKQIRIG